MSTNRRRPTGGIRRPQVAGRPRPAQGPTGEPDEATEQRGGLAVDERTAQERTAQEQAAQQQAVRQRPTGAEGTADAERTEGLEETEAGGDEHAPGEPSTVRATPVGGGSEPDTGEPASRTEGAAAPARRVWLPRTPTTGRATAILLVVTILLAAAAVFFAVSSARMWFSGATTNTALTDVGTTAAVSEQVGDDVKKVYSFDFARLDQAEADARASITGQFTNQFNQIFANVRQLAPKQQAVVTATIPKSAVASIHGNDATVYLFVNQVITRVDDAGKPTQGSAAARLRVDAQYVDGSWKIANMSPA